MKLPLIPLLGSYSDSALARDLAKWIKDAATKINQVASGTLAGMDGTYSAVPTSGTWAKGDFVRNSAPAELGVVTAKYVVFGWIRLTGGSGNVLNTDWVEVRTLTGN